MTIAPTKRKRKRRNKNHYFTKVHEEAIVTYASSTSSQEKRKLYIEYIQPAFSELIRLLIHINLQHFPTLMF